MTTPTKITDHVARLLGWQLDRFATAVRFRELAAALGEEIQLLEDVAHDTMTKQLSAEAVGKQLDRWGRIVALARTSTDDAIYRARLEVEQLINCSSGGSRVLQEIVHRLVGASVRYLQAGCAFFLLDYEREEHSAAATRADVEQAMFRAACSGVAFAVSEARPTTFRYSTGPGYSEGGYGVLVAQAVRL